MSEPTQPTSGSTTDTTVDNLVPPGAESFEGGFVDGGHGDPIFDIARLATYLAENFPDQVNLTNRQVPEGPVDTAIRLLQGLSATAPSETVPRCAEAYCNKPSGHAGEHGWVQYG